MSKKKPIEEVKPPIKENSFDMGIAGGAGAVSTSPGWGTFASPAVSQTPGNFATSDNNKALGSHSNTATGTPASSSALDVDVTQIYNKSDTPSPDEVMQGLKYEMQNMIKKDKSRAKEIVLGNLKQDPHYYGKLHMWNIDDKDMMNIQPANQPKSDGPAITESEEQMNERIKLLDKMMEAKGKKAETPQSFKDALAETKAKRDAQYGK